MFHRILKLPAACSYFFTLLLLPVGVTVAAEFF
jgi:hypothetical protein